MTIIPTINCENFECVKKRLKETADFLPASASWRRQNKKWVQIDISDGKFTAHKTWNNPRALRELKIKNSELRKLNLEIHLMVENPLKQIEAWKKTGAKRIIVHLEALENNKLISLKTDKLKRLKAEKLKSCPMNCEIGLAINPETPVENIIPYINKNNRVRVNPRLFRIDPRFVQILAVSPGKSGQKFQPQILKKIKFLKKNYPKIVVEIDGGINLKTGRLCQKAGADILVVGSYLWKSDNPRQAYKKLSKII